MQSLLILVKNPVAGKTKTRLAESVGHERALKMYHQLMEYTRDQALHLAGTRRLLFYSEAVIENDAWPSEDFDKRVQEGPGLGERMANALQTAFAAGAERAVIIGSDCPGITASLLKKALDCLHDNDLVIGPALDGGYYLLGMTELHPELFSGIEWSTEKVAKQTLAKAKALGLSAAELVPLSDVDYLEDWESYGWAVPE